MSGTVNRGLHCCLFSQPNSQPSKYHPWQPGSSCRRHCFKLFRGNAYDGIYLSPRPLGDRGRRITVDQDFKTSLHSKTRASLKINENLGNSEMPTASMVFLYHPPNSSLDSSIFVSIFPSHREYSEKVFLKLAYTTYSWMGQYVLHVADSTLAVFFTATTVDALPSAC